MITPCIETSTANKILLVDDDTLLSEQMSLWFEQEGYEAVIADDLDCSHITDLAHYRSVVVDLALGRSSGYEALVRLKDKGFSGAVYIVSGMHRSIIEHAVKRGKELGLNVTCGYQKPLLHKEVIEIANQLSFLPEPELEEPGRNLLTIEQLEYCVEREKIEFLIQPVFSARSSEIVGGELLARARVAGRLMSIAPAVRELSTRNLEKLTRQAFQNAAFLASTAEFQKNDVRLSLNVPSCLIDSQFFARLIFEYQLESFAKRVTLEVSEIDKIGDEERALANMTRAIGTGFRFSLDDFGRGTSNLDRLLFFPCAEIKLDRLYGHGCASDAKKLAVSQNVVSLARSLGLTITAEGIEEASDLDILTAMGVDHFQGYIQYRPMERSEFLKLIFLRSSEANEAIQMLPNQNYLKN